MAERLQPPRKDGFTVIENDFLTDKLDETIQFYGIEPHAFSTDSSVVVERAKELLSVCQIDASFAVDPVRNLHLLAIANDMFDPHAASDTGLSETLVKAIAVVVDENGQEVSLISGKRVAGNKNGQATADNIRALSAHEIRKGKELEDFLRVYQDEKLSAAQAAELSDWQSENPLTFIREKFAIKKETEQAFGVDIVAVSTREMSEQIGARGLCIWLHGKPRMIFGFDASPRLKQHEYLHSQFRGMRFGRNGLLHRGVDEALIESSVQYPETYEPQRLTLSFIEKLSPETAVLMRSAFFGNDRVWQAAYSRIIAEFGLDGFLACARLASTDNPKNDISLPEDWAARLLLPASQVMEKLYKRKVKTRPLVAA
jgi:hypothetical protein